MSLSRSTAVVALLACLAATACGPQRSPSATAAAEGLPAYGPEESALFDDSLAPDVLVLEGTGPAAPDEAALAERARRAELIVPARVATVTRDSATARSQPKYQLSLRATATPLLGELADPLITLDVRTGGPSYSTIRRSEDSLMGRRVIVLARRFAAGGDAVVHWHAVADTPQARATVRRIVELSR